MDQNTPSAPKTKDRYRIEIKMSADEKDLIERGAAAVKQGISEFVRSAAAKAATEALKGN